MRIVVGSKVQPTMRKGDPTVGIEICMETTEVESDKRFVWTFLRGKFGHMLDLMPTHPEKVKLGSFGARSPKKYSEDGKWSSCKVVI